MNDDWEPEDSEWQWGPEHRTGCLPLLILAMAVAVPSVCIFAGLALWMTLR